MKKRSDFMKKILIEVNQKCNLKCEYCFYNDYGRTKEEITLKEIIKNNIASYEEIYITGGEPFLNNHIYEILNYLKNKKITVFSNGIILNTKWQVDKILDLIKKIIITFDSIDVKYSLRKKYEKEVISIIEKILKCSNKKLEVKICVNRYNIDKLEDTIKFLIDLGVKNLSFNLIHNIESSKKDFMIREEKKYKKIFYLLEKYSEYFSIKNINSLKSYYKKDYFYFFKSCKCGEDFFFMNNKGELFPCPANLKKEEKKEKCFSRECINLWELF